MKESYYMRKKREKLEGTGVIKSTEKKVKLSTSEKNKKALKTLFKDTGDVTVEEKREKKSSKTLFICSCGVEVVIESDNTGHHNRRKCYRCLIEGDV